MKILVVGGGGREHAMAWKIKQSPRCSKLLCAPGNAGTAEVGVNVGLAAEDVPGLLKLAKDQKIDLTVIGPEAPLCEGIVDAFEAEGLRVFGPNQAGAQLEGDKAHAKAMMRAHAIPTAEARVFQDFKNAYDYVATRDEPIVVKAAGLAAGKGVIVCDDPPDALLALERIMKKHEFGSAGDTVVVEERLEGQEVSILAFVDGRNIYVMESSQDHKAIGAGDTGPNTGGMGAYCPAPIVTEELMALIERQVLVPIVDAMNRQGTPYKGILYAGLMLTPAGPKVLEFNCRFGDPETQPVLMRLDCDLVEVMEAVIDGKLDQVTLKWDPRPAVCVVMASGGYPGSYEKGKVITGLEEAGALPDVVVFHAGTKAQDGQVVTSGGRVLGVTALGSTIASAKQRAYEAVDKIQYEGAYCRRDIADKAMRGGA
ncbi:MAG: phosphoribosylamine--glycine ligase [Phycisphaerae bacterium]|nr:phosphoribosylamine--glycine ligase [Phycisphaerae bacterium]